MVFIFPFPYVRIKTVKRHDIAAQRIAQNHACHGYYILRLKNIRGFYYKSVHKKQYRDIGRDKGKHHGPDKRPDFKPAFYNDRERCRGNHYTEPCHIKEGIVPFKYIF